MFSNKEFMNFMGYRNMLIKEKIEECLSMARKGETEIDIEWGELTDSEVEYVESEVERRIRNRSY